MICLKCGKDHDGTFGSGKYCSRSCANSRIHSSETKKKIKDSLLSNTTLIGKHLSQETKDKISSTLRNRFGKVNVVLEDKVCPLCGKIFQNKRTKFCSKKCGQIGGGRISSQIQSENRRSKNEIAMYDLCKEKFTNVENNAPIFNGWDADIIIHDFKLAIMWNGKWHYEKLTQKHSVEQVQNRDNIKIGEIKKCGYTPYIIKDLSGGDLNLVNMEFDKLLKFIDTL